MIGLSGLLVDAARWIIPRPLRATLKHYLPISVSRRFRRPNKAAPPPHLVALPLPPQTDETSQRIARMLAGPMARAVRSDEITEGTRNNGIIIHRVEGSRIPALEFVQKITIGQPESMLSYCIMKAGLRFAARDLVPSIYGVTQDERNYHIFMERLQNFGRPSEAECGHELADALASATLHFSQSVQNLLNEVKCRFPLRQVPERRARHKLRAIVTSTGEASLATLLDEIEDKLCRFDVVISHNDLHWENISVTWNDGAPKLRFIDFNCLGKNFAGADLHFFAKEAWRNPGTAAFFTHMSEAYARLSGIPANLPRSAAYLAAAHYEAGRRQTSQTKADAVALILEAHRELSSLALVKCSSLK